ncbi:hypothetical protein SAICODRAFT_16002 [Saitoella complicata NRRL Y-17804]|uniref:F-box domain-containing protein n=1 Tax=Saitoella complicata (strain BCRC 22490 / CBS 7301 / JCM 7358 / NBRC 10748 / NRRL Y-17804) TaxID=698492 RepID=A0A0E9NNX0_SAICN|nr:uncharacterized protein SAICODRAFT_16002 [Saitoella complicata NRRL Y-17804]ODQ55943.1 hypothetical protein SAICODRAFT_16002 [Saitoella complicata NRRL Y-17804]GAO51498.1 hypothetical protein G7K_5597-t1 [Saitoella complicata NRRL Y-17804]
MDQLGNMKAFSRPVHGQGKEPEEETDYLSDLPTEIFSVIVLSLPLSSITALSTTSKAIHNVINTSTHLWQSLFLRDFDSPRPAFPRDQFRAHYKERMVAIRRLGNSEKDVLPEAVGRVLHDVIEENEAKNIALIRRSLHSRVDDLGVCLPMLTILLTRSWLDNDPSTWTMSPGQVLDCQAYIYRANVEHFLAANSSSYESHILLICILRVMLHWIQTNETDNDIIADDHFSKEHDLVGWPRDPVRADFQKDVKESLDGRWISLYSYLDYSDFITLPERMQTNSEPYREFFDGPQYFDFHVESPPTPNAASPSDGYRLISGRGVDFDSFSFTGCARRIEGMSEGYALVEWRKIYDQEDVETRWIYTGMLVPGIGIIGLWTDGMEEDGPAGPFICWKNEGW